MLVATVLPTAVCVTAAPTILLGSLKATFGFVVPTPKPAVEIPVLEKSIHLIIGLLVSLLLQL